MLKNFLKPDQIYCKRFANIGDLDISNRPYSVFSSTSTKVSATVFAMLVLVRAIHRMRVIFSPSI
jgi:hypothetical protein